MSEWWGWDRGRRAAAEEKHVMSAVNTARRAAAEEMRERAKYVATEKGRALAALKLAEPYRTEPQYRFDPEAVGDDIAAAIAALPIEEERG